MSDSSPSADPYVPRTHAVVVKFRDDVPIPYEDGAEEHVRRLGVGPWDRLAEEFPGITLRRAFTSVSPERLRELVEAAVRQTPSYRPYGFLSAFRIECPAGVDPHALARALAAWPDVEEAYAEMPVYPADVPGPSNYYMKEQTYLQPAPLGIDVHHAWTVQGGDGTGQRGADIEYAWMLDHEDLAGQPLNLVHGAHQPDLARLDHGTAVAGILCARDNDLGICGIAYKVDVVMLVSLYIKKDTFVSSADALVSAVSHLNPGSVLLIEIAPGLQGVPTFPVEVLALQREVITLATAGGIVVIEPGGNNHVDLDTHADAEGRLRLNPSSPDFIDSGAIMVGASQGGATQPPASWTTRGRRVDCFAQGEAVRTTKSYKKLAEDYQRYTYDFDGTSAAGAIIAGAALSIQGMAQAKLGSRLTPAAMRALLRNPDLTTPSANGAADRIGRMPDLKRIAGALNPPKVALLTPTVPILTMFELQVMWNAAVFEVTSLEPMTATFEIESPFVLPPPWGITAFGTTATTTSAGAVPGRARLWFSLTQVPGITEAVPPLEVTIRCKETDETFTVTLVHKFLQVPFLATAMVLDRSGSMLHPAGKTGLKKIEALRQAASTFVALNPPTAGALPGNQLGVVGFASEAETIQGATVLEDAGVLGQISTLLQGITADPQGATAIGRGLLQGNALLGSLAPAEALYERAILVFTDGKENVDPMIAQVMGEGQIDPSTRVFAVGLGTPDQVSTEALSALTAASGGYCLLTGELLPETEDFFRLSKYFMQVLFDLTAEETSTDPDGVLLPGQQVRVPFVVTEADARAQVVLLADVPVVELEVETPSGEVLAADAPGVTFGAGPFVRFGRVVLPQGTAHAGTWHARLTVPHDLLDRPSGVSSVELRRASVEGVRYSVSASVRSSLRLEGTMERGWSRPGEPLRARVALTEYGLPVEGRASVEARVRRPGGSTVTVPLDETEPGVFELTYPAAQAGAYEVRLLASGRTFGGNGFTRERLMTGAVVSGSVAAPVPATDDECCRGSQRLLRILVLLAAAAIPLLLLLLVLALLIFLAL